MLKGNRWQLAAFFISAVLFVSVLIGRFSLASTPEQPPLPTNVVIPTATQTETPPTDSPTETSASLAVTATPQDTIITFREGIVGSVFRLNPLYAALNPAERDVTSLIFEGLTQINQYGEAVGDLALNWVVSRDGLEYVFTLRRDILWQDGIPFDADDVVFTYQLIGSSDFTGAREQQAFWRTVEIEKLSDDMVRFRLAQPLASFPTILTIGILPEHALQGTTASQLASHPFNLAPIGTGAYQLEGLRSSDGITINAIDLRLAPVYQQRPEGQSGFQIERIRFVLFETLDAAQLAFVSQTIDGLASRTMDDRPALLRLGNADVYTEVDSTVGMLLYNWDGGDDHRFFSDPRVRNALMIGMSRIAPIESQLIDRAILADSPILFSSWAYINAMSGVIYDPTRALDLLNNANITRPEAEASDGYLYAFTLLTSDDPALVSIAQQIATQWAQYNLNVRVESVTREVLATRLESGEFDAVIAELALGADPDVYAYWHSGQYPDGLNYGGTTDDRVSELLERARRDSNGLNRIQLYRDFQNTFITRAIAIPLYYPLFSYAVDEDVDGVQLSFIAEPADRFRTIQSWTIVNN